MNITVDTHVHTVASGHAYSTLLEIVQSAMEKGLKLIAMTDHGPAMPGGPHLYHFGNMRVIPRIINGVEILKGVEANILDYQGTLDMPEQYLLKMEIVLAGMHVICYPGGTIEENTQAMIKVLHNPLVDVLVHPGNPEYPIDANQVIECAMDKNVAIEINNSSLIGSRRGSLSNCQQIARIIAKKGAKIVLGSDSHIAMDVGRLQDAITMIKEAGVRDEQIINHTPEKLKAYLIQRRPVREEIFRDIN